MKPVYCYLINQRVIDTFSSFCAVSIKTTYVKVKMRSSKVRYLDIAVLLSLLLLFLIFLVLDIIPWLNNQSGKTVVYII